MKIIGSVKEDITAEKRISITPETIKKFADLKFSLLICFQELQEHNQWMFCLLKQI